jgi:DNA mismatch repair ATPase MutS
VSLSLVARGCLITGANMSGKSTLLRTLGINALLAQTLFTCPAQRYRASRLRIVSSMRVSDDILEGKSRYMAEAERLLALVREAGDRPTALCLIDELLSGTNVAERLAASRAILDYLARQDMLVVVATHDIELTHALRTLYDSYFFGDELGRDDLRFEYRLRRGVATTRNAVRLLERLGYPEAIVARARGEETPRE